jgi:hypothetical protein
MTYRELLEEDDECTLTAEQLDEVFDPWAFLSRIDVLFERVEALEFCLRSPLGRNTARGFTRTSGARGGNAHRRGAFAWHRARAHGGGGTQ